MQALPADQPVNGKDDGEKREEREGWENHGNPGKQRKGRADAVNLLDPMKEGRDRT